uniref:Acb2/Tad1 hairpin domain-containing protein n=1 Tax=viral metagenome TaxID=1070528 RepID=A0A6M3LTZ8_9ZZZZ
MPLDFEKIYKYHAPKEGQAAKYEALRAKAKELAELVRELCPESREQSVAFTHIETAIMWANAGIARS